MGFVFQQRSRHLQLRAVLSIIPVSRVRYRARTPPPQNPESWQAFQKFVISPSAGMEKDERQRQLGDTNAAKS
jgi:hypothetical protein